MFGNMFKSMEFSRKAISLEKKLKGKKDSEQKSCKNCTYCCWQKPCNLVKEDISIMAKHFNITPEELFDTYLVVDTAGVDCGMFTLTPIRVEWKLYAGGFLPADATYDLNTPCIFLNEKEKKCSLHDTAKPQGGKDAECWVEDSVIEENKYGFTKAELKELVGWNGNEYENDDEESPWDNGDMYEDDDE